MTTACPSPPRDPRSPVLKERQPPTPSASILSRMPSNFGVVAEVSLSQIRCTFPLTGPVASSDSASSSRDRSPSLSSANGTGLLARRRSSAGQNGNSRPDFSMTEFKLSDLPNNDPFAIREHIIGQAAAADTPDASEAGTPSGIVAQGIVERAFNSVKIRQPTPFPEKRGVFISDDEDEDDPDDAPSDDDGDVFTVGSQSEPSSKSFKA